MNDNKFPQMDWGQVVLNGGPPCFHIEGPQYCGRAERWPGHGNPAFHGFVSLDAALQQTVADEQEQVAALTAERDRLRADYLGLAQAFRDTAFALHVNANHKPAAFSACQNGICAEACRRWNKLIDADA